MAVSICLFGSEATGTTDSLSDKDILVVCDDASAIPKDIIENWHKEGWTPTYFTWSHLLRRAVKGDLFVNHLKQDGLIIEDESGQLTQILSDFAPRADYSDETARAMIMLRVADREIANDWMGAMVCHVLYKFTRFGFTNLLANEKIYPSTYQQAIEAFSDIGGNFSEDEFKAFSAIKDIQRTYLARQESQHDAHAMIGTLKNVMTRLFAFEFENIKADADARLLQAYSTSRDVEARIVSHHNPIEMDKGEILPDIWKMIKNPKTEGWAMNGGVNSDVLNDINIAITASFED